MFHRNSTFNRHQSIAQRILLEGKDRTGDSNVVRGQQRTGRDVSFLLTTSTGVILLAEGLWRGVTAEVNVGRADRLV